MSKDRATVGADGIALPLLPPARDARVWARMVRVVFYTPGFLALLLLKAGEPTSFGITVELLMLSSAAAIVAGLYIGTLRFRRRIVAGRLPPYPEPEKRTDLFVVLGEIHNPRRLGPSETPSWLVIPERGLFTGIAVLGAVGTGKTSCCMYPYTEQILAYKADDPAQRIGGLVLEVKGDFCRKVKQILGRHGNPLARSNRTPTG